jgi:hypothetical protein
MMTIKKMDQMINRRLNILSIAYHINLVVICGSICFTPSQDSNFSNIEF